MAYSQYLTEAEHRELIYNYKQKFKDTSWDNRKPLFIVVINCSNKDTLFFSISVLRQQFQYTCSYINYFYRLDEDDILIRLNSDCKGKWDLYSPITSNDSVFLKNKLLPNSVLMSYISHTLVYCKPRNEHPILLEEVSRGYIPKRYFDLLPLKHNE